MNPKFQASVHTLDLYSDYDDEASWSEGDPVVPSPSPESSTYESTLRLLGTAVTFAWDLIVPSAHAENPPKFNHPKDWPDRKLKKNGNGDVIEWVAGIYYTPNVCVKDDRCWVSLRSREDMFRESIVYKAFEDLGQKYNGEKCRVVTWWDDDIGTGGYIKKDGKLCGDPDEPVWVAVLCRK